MKFFLLSLLIICFSDFLLPQNELKVQVKDHDSNEPLAGVNIIFLSTGYGASTDQNGIAVLHDIPDGGYDVKFSFLGYNDEFIKVFFPGDSGRLLNIRMEPEAEELEEIAVSSTRVSRLISNEPTRVEVIAGEEIDEKITMDPSGISMILNESTGIQVQQTSAASANNSFRIQGLDGRYTQLLKDDFPLYSGFSGSLSIVQILPLDLKQVEIIKGSASTLFGGGAIAGLINLVSKDPDPEGDLSFLLNGTSASGIDLSGYYSNRSEKTGMTFLISGNKQIAYDNNDDQFSDLPEIERYTLLPKLFFYLNENVLELGLTFTAEERTGGAIPEIRGENDPVYSYAETNESRRFSGVLRYSHFFSKEQKLVLKNSIGYFDRELTIPSYSFSGLQLSTFSEAAYITAYDEGDFIAGLNLVTENFNDRSIVAAERDYSDLSAGIFSQITADFSDQHSAEAGIRLDYAPDYELIPLPRISFLSKWNKNLTTRAGGGLGYKLPTLFTEKSEEILFAGVLPLDKNRVEVEKSYGINLDINFNTIIFNSVTFSLNNLVFYTRINNPLILIPSHESEESFEFTSFDGHYDTRGIETNIKLTYNYLKLFTGYTFTDVESHGQIRETFPLTPKHRLGIVLILEEHENYRIGLEAYYTGRQNLSDGTTGRDYWINGLMIEKHIGNVSVFLNFENFLDTRQSKFGPMYTGQASNPDFVEIYAPTDGRIINGGVKVRI